MMGMKSPVINLRDALVWRELMCTVAIWWAKMKYLWIYVVQLWRNVVNLHSPSNLETAPCWVSMCWAKSYPRKLNRESSRSRCCDTRALSVDGVALPAAAALPANRPVAGGTEPGDGTLGDRPTAKNQWKLHVFVTGKEGVISKSPPTILIQCAINAVN